MGFPPSGQVMDGSSDRWHVHADSKSKLKLKCPAECCTPLSPIGPILVAVFQWPSALSLLERCCFEDPSYGQPLPMLLTLPSVLLTDFDQSSSMHSTNPEKTSPGTGRQVSARCREGIGGSGS